MKQTTRFDVNGRSTRVVIHWGFNIWWVPKKYYGTTLGWHIFIRDSPLHPNSHHRVAHELVHVYQRRRLWWIAFLPKYLAVKFWMAIRGKDSYRDHPMEIEARGRYADIEDDAEIILASARAKWQRLL